MTNYQYDTTELGRDEMHTNQLCAGHNYMYMKSYNTYICIYTHTYTQMHLCIHVHAYVF